jgi:hypothetical protein
MAEALQALPTLYWFALGVIAGAGVYVYWGRRSAPKDADQQIDLTQMHSALPQTRPGLSPGVDAIRSF